MKELWAYTDNRISVRFEYEYRDAESPDASAEP
jgi:nuclear transport factor 2 (NTF2) superfamily protein